MTHPVNDTTIPPVTDTTAGKAPPTGGRPQERVRPTWPLYLLFLGVAGVIGGTIAYSFLGESLAALGIPDPGIATTFGLPFFRAVGWMLAALSAGSFLFSAFLISPRLPGGDNARLHQASLSVDGHLASRTGAVAALCFGLVALLMIPLVLSDVSGTPLAQTLGPEALVVALQQVAMAQVWLIVALIALVTGLTGLMGRAWITQPLLLLGAILMIIPLGLTGHSSSGGDHDHGTNSYLWHLIFLVIWIGGLMALLAHGRRLGPDLNIALRRYSTIALVSIIIMAVSGLVNAAIRIELTDLLTTRYGLIIVAKTIGVIILGVFGWIHRAWVIPQVQADPTDHRLFRQVAIVEILVMAAVTGIAITMGRTPPPPPRIPNLSQMATELGYELSEKPTALNVWGMWRFDLLFGTLALLLAAGYLYAVWRTHQAGRTWSTTSTAWWLAGCVTLLATMSSGIGMNMPASFSMHMLGHMILSLVIPIFLVLGAPLTLLMTAYDSDPAGRPGIHDWVCAFTRSRLVAMITHPVVNTMQFLFFFYVMYLLIPLYELLISEHAGHLIMNTVLLVSGCFYFWGMCGPDPLPHRRPAAVRLGWLIASLPVHLPFGVYLLQLDTILGQAFYRSLLLPWELDLLADQRAAVLAWATGVLPLAFVAFLLSRQLRGRGDSTRGVEEVATPDTGGTGTPSLSPPAK
ncbi:bifunctional copper resistance protein CopD/cytochrome c oxidase assembly protein [Corynebacterium sp. YIM 101645]|uniref:Bifunctional copper resistance protein CopD/cytochrome c oxidase assembly protein n=1 Tax=Corynebacterium lemuris TaxID=1859292 RepID=A0ABT2FZ98_9CORY|nr:bifunctional copper resistance protein CopD/cytochrome c oxidase assembly protein [Corynebacterium lemuris]MCS5480561.1 bifunctional copper resistance protein CopD/cytochrome c oxidase assembly protein [Corynebacterium lemuris]